jgi:predicted Zn finger-like uncharacterized protein
LYTQCPDCSTVFRVTAEALRVAQGRVRCGICSAGFNALDNLSEAPVARALGEDGHEDTFTVEEMPGNEIIELSGVSDDDTGEPAEQGTTEKQPASEDRAGEDSAMEPTATEERTEVELAEAGLPSEDLLEAEPAMESLAGEQPAGVESAQEEPSGDEPATDEQVVAETSGGEQADAEPADDDWLVEEDAASAVDEPVGDPLDVIADGALEFHGSAEDLERLFVPAGAKAYGGEPVPSEVPHAIEEIASQDLSGIEVREDFFDWPASSDSPFDPGNPAHVAAVLASSSGEARSHREGDLDRTDEYPVLVVEDYEATLQSAEPEPAGEADAGPRLATQDDEAHEPGEPLPDQPPDDTPLLIIPEELRHGPSATAADDLAAPLDLDEEAPRRWPLAAAAGLLAVALGAQAIHHWRQDLVRNPATGPWMLRGYQALGLELRPPVDLGAFELRQLGAASDPGQAGRIKVRASIVNQAPFAQPYPLLRLSLQDRFGSTIGARNLTPQEYLPGAAADASGLLGASQRADAEVVFVDPGRDAVGFELDVCAESESGLRCGADLPRNPP